MYIPALCHLVQSNLWSVHKPKYIYKDRNTRRRYVGMNNDGVSTHPRYSFFTIIIYILMHCMAGNIGREYNLAIWQSSIELPNFKLPKLLHTKLYSYGCATIINGCWKCLDSRGRTIPSCVLANLCTPSWSVVILFPMFGGSSFHGAHCYFTCHLRARIR